MKRILCGAVVVSAILLAAPFHSARAADLGVKVPAPPPAPPAYSWTGFYIGGEGGYAWAYPDLTLDSGPLTQQSTSFANHGGFGGGFIGYQYEFGWTHIVAGLEAEYNAASIKGNATSSLSGLLGAGPGTVTLAQSATLNSFGSVDGRLGVALVGMGFDHMLLYITGGVAFGDPKQTATTLSGTGSAAPPASAVGTTATFDGGNKTGWDFGAGIDYWLTTNWIFRGEWRMYNFPSESITFSGKLIGAFPAAGLANTSETVNVARAGVIYKF